MLRFVLALACLFVLATAQARPPVSYADSVAAYEAGDTDVARAAFRRLAENGYANAQFRLGGMLLEGEGGPEDAVEGSLWIRLAASAGHESAAESAPGAMQALAPEQREAIEERLPDWQDRYSKTALVERHAPRMCDECRGSASGRLRQVFGTEEVVLHGSPALLHMEPPRYPRELRRRGIPGYVQMGAWVGPAGEFVNPHVIFSDPEWIFDGPALAALQEWQVEWTEGAPGPEARYVSQGIMFYVGGRSWERKAKAQYERIIDRWDEDPDAGYRAARMASILEFGDVVGGHEGLLAKMHRAASSGLARAQIDLYDHLQAGRGVQPDEEAAAFWLQRAAFSGDALARFLLSLEDEFDPQFNRALLLSAAEAGCNPAIMTVLRQQLAAPETADKKLLEKLVGLLPEFWYMVNPDQNLVDRAKELVSG
ncbi:MAG: hypothetical protein GVY11_01095 [Gammaproteobacteria bacterium]|jgi:TPR repeat protein|nr:hypothetical protein [Gammaproteobacteria bacterium]